MFIKSITVQHLVKHREAIRGWRTAQLVVVGVYSILKFIVTSEVSDLIFKIVISHDVPPRSSTLYTVFSRTGWGRWRRGWGREIS